MLSNDINPIDVFVDFKDYLKSDPNLQNPGAKSKIENYASAVIAITPFSYKSAYYEIHGLNKKPFEVLEQGELSYLGFLRVPTLPNALESAFETAFGRKMDKTKLVIVQIPVENDFVSDPLKKIVGLGQIVAIFELAD